VLTYDRKLTEGSGPSIYGLQVCEAMGLSKEFMSKAKKVQNKLESDIVCSSKQSQYNPDVFVDECKICGSKEKLETHHIKDQQFADKHKMIDHHHKNINHNLVPLCASCHLKVTHFEYVVTGWKETTQGRVLEWHKAEKKNMTRKKHSPGDVEKIIGLKNEAYPTLSQKDFVRALDVHHGIKVSISIWGKMSKGTY